MRHQAVMANLRSCGVDVELLMGKSIALLPEDILRKGTDVHETTDMAAFCKILRAYDVDVFTLIDAGIDLPAMDRRSGDKWFGTIWIINTLAIPLLIGAFGNFLGNRMEEALTRKPSVEDSVEIHVEIIVGANCEKAIRYEGGYNGLKAILAALQDSDNDCD